MSLPARDLCVSLEEYLKREEASEARNEYVAGRVFAMVGASETHNLIVSNLSRNLYDPVMDSGCRVYMSDMKVWIQSAQSFYYPDIVVTCEPFEPKSVYKSAPCLIVEVLSPSTRDVDCREKLIAYRQLPSLKEYILVYQDRMQIEVYRKDDRGDWHCNIYEGNSKVQLNALPNAGLELDLEKVYRGTTVHIA